ncbi:MAG: hypothetical protein HYY25_14405 [Candidatus Wallbacteria bacterium]|nr:hypothetical protein [Candidatus Wallbacteria bacterium]
MTLNRTQLTLLWAAVAVVVAGYARPVQSVAGVPVERFFYMKMLWHHEFDVVVAGDSRPLLGVSPAAMREALPGRRIANFGFRLAGYSRQYVERAESLLDPASPGRVLVLGVDPHALTTNAARDIDTPSTWMSLHPWRPGHFNVDLDNEFLWLSAQHPAEIRLAVALSPIHSFFGRLTSLDLNQLFYTKERRPMLIAHEDGWFESRMGKWDQKNVLRYIPPMYKGNPVSPHVIQKLMEMVRGIRDRGVAVYGFEPPTSDEVGRLENLHSKFEEKAFATAFEAAGATWLPFRDADFETWDGHHLSQESALRFSRALAERIAAAERAAGR